MSQCDPPVTYVDAFETDDVDGADLEVVTCCGRRRAPSQCQKATSTRDCLPMRGVSVTPCVKGGARGGVRFTGSDPVPVCVEWVNLPADAIINRFGLVATNLPPGKYEAYVTGGTATSRSLQAVTVPELTPPFFLGFQTRPATKWPWNGEVRVRIENCPEGALFVWNTGARTHSPRLTNARPGVYSVRVVCADTGAAICECGDVARVLDCL